MKQTNTHFLNYTANLRYKINQKQKNTTLVLEVPKHLSKYNIINYFQNVYNLPIKKVNIINPRSITVSSNKKLLKRRNFKKAIITL